MASRLAFLSLLVLAALRPPAAVGQHVIGRVLEEGSDAPVSAAFVVLLDDEDRRLAGALTDPTGAFRLRAPHPGRYRIRVDRIGYVSTTTLVFSVTRDGGGPLTIRVSGDALVLEPIEVEAGRRCVLRPEEGQATYTLWGEARKALEIADWVGAEERFVFDALRFNRFIGAREMVVDTETVEGIRITGREPFLSQSGVRLISEGFIQGWAADRRFYGPDAALLLSDAFLDAYCFRSVPGPTPATLGLAFEPVSDDGPPGIEGILWLDRATGELKSLDFRYANAELPLRVDPDRYGGMLRFHRVPGGAWIISHWKIRAPVLYRNARRIWIEGFTETEAEVFAVHGADGSSVEFERVGAFLTGQVLRGRGRDPVAGARVHLDGTPYETESDAEGRFFFEGVPAGRYRATAEGGGLRRAVDAVVELVRGDTTTVVLWR